MKHIMVVPVGEKTDTDALYVGIREFPTEKVYLIARKDRMDSMREVRKDLEKFKLPVSVIEMAESNHWEETFRAINEITHIEKGKDIIIKMRFS